MFSFSVNFVTLKHIIYILSFFLLSFNTFAGDSRNGSKEQLKNVFIKVTSDSGEELAGAKILVTETGKEYFTDLNGQIQLQVKQGEDLTLKLSTIGFEEKIVKTSQLGTINELTIRSL